MLDMLTDPTYGLMTLIVLALAGLPLYVAWRCLNGDLRTWAVLPPIPFQISRHNTWPPALAPRWFREWTRRLRTDPAASPWTLAEIEMVRAAPASRRRTRALRDIERVAGAHHVEGLVPEDWLERAARRGRERGAPPGHRAQPPAPFPGTGWPLGWDP